MQRLIVNGEEDGCLPNKNGRRLPVGQRVSGILGGMSGMLLSQTVVRWAIEIQSKWDRLMLTKVAMACMT